MFSFFTKKIVIGAVLGVAVIAVVALKLNNGNGREFYTVKKSDVVQQVATTGKVKPEDSVDLGFDKTGRVARVYVKIGQAVSQGDVIATLDTSETTADLQKAKAVLNEEMIKLREVKKTAPSSYGDAYQNLSIAVKGGFVDADNAVRNRTDQFFKTPTTNPQFEFYITNGNFINYFNVPADTKIELDNQRKAIGNILVDWQNRVGNLTKENVETESEKAIEDLTAISNFLDKVASAINTFTPAEYAYETTVTTYKTSVASARSEVSTSISAIVTAKDKLNSAPVLGQNGEFESVLSQQAKVTQAEAAVAALEAALSKSIITAPFTGVVTKQDAEVGATVSSGAALVSVASQNQIYIEANISEIHVGKIAPQNPVIFTLDAFPGETFEGFVYYIEPGDTIIDGVVNYKIRVNLVTPDPRIKNGLTANLKIETAKKQNVLTIPMYAITKEGEQNFVNRMVNEKTEKVPVTLGLLGNDGLVEILSGLSENDTIEYGELP